MPVPWAAVGAAGVERQGEPAGLSRSRVLPRPIVQGEDPAMRSTFGTAMLMAASSLTWLYAAGGIDTRFGVDGIVVTSTGPGAAPDLQGGLAIQRDDRILVGGQSYMGEDAGGFQWRVTRYMRNGDIDAAFGVGGSVLTNMSDLGGLDERMVSLAVQHDGKIVAAGSIQTSSSLDEDSSALARFNPDGTLDTSFGDGGKVVFDVAPGHDFVNQVLVDRSERILVGGGCQHFFLTRYEADGTLDPSFNREGPVPGLVITEVSSGENAHDNILGIVLDERERIVAGGFSITFEDGAPNVDSTLARYLPDGTLDTSFNHDGPRPGIVVTSVAPGGGWDVIFDVALDRHGRILTVGDAYVGAGTGGFDVALSRYLPDGSLDNSFGSGGIVLTNAGPGDSDDDAQAVAIQTNGRILIAGSAAPTAFLVDSDFMVARYNSNGSLDRSFGVGGIAITPTGAEGGDDEIWAVAFQSGSRLVASGECDQPSTGRDVCLVRYGISDPND